MITDLRCQTNAPLHEALDEGQLRQLRAEGEVMDSDQAATYALDAIRRARRSQYSEGKYGGRPGRDRRARRAAQYGGDAAGDGGTALDDRFSTIRIMSSSRPRIWPPETPA
jgi:hypothetical protein